MTLVKLFFVFARIGLFTFGGGYGMIPLIQQEVVSRGWMDAEALLRYIGICESTPGPIAVNLATFVGAAQGGFPGSLCATLGVVTPSFAVILLIASALKRFRENPLVRSALSGIRPVVAGMITASGLYIAMRCALAGLGTETALSIDIRQFIIAALLAAATAVWRLWLKRPFSPIMLILFSALCGIAVYGI